MLAYRFYRIKKDGHIEMPPYTVELANDVEAVRQAKKFVDGCDIEIWQGSRIVNYLASDDK